MFGVWCFGFGVRRPVILLLVFGVVGAGGRGLFKV